MSLDSIHGIIDRRVLLNYRIAPDILARALPAPFRPKTYAGWGIGGICMIRFRDLRPRAIPAWLGLRSENAAHRIAIEWDQDGKQNEGVFIPRRDTNSWLNHFFGGRVFPGIFHRSSFKVAETDQSVSIRIVWENGEEEAAFSGTITSQIPATSIFPDLDTASKFFSAGDTGYSVTRKEGHYHGMVLRTLDWTISPMAIEFARSRFFSDPKMFPPGSVQLDNALIMKQVRHEWHSRPDLHLSQDHRFLTAI